MYFRLTVRAGAIDVFDSTFTFEGETSFADNTANQGGE